MFVRHLSEMWDLDCGQGTNRARRAQGQVQSKLSRAGVWQAFEFELSETRVFEIPLPLFERRHFYGSELR